MTCTCDSAQTPYGKQYGDEYDFPSRGFADGQPEFQESLTRGLSEAPYEAPVARGQTRREAQVLVSRLNGICEASLKVDHSSSRHFMTPLQQGLEFTHGSRVHSKYGRIDSKGSLATVIARGRGVGGSVPKSASGADRYTMIYDDGVVVEAVPRNSMRPLAKRSAPAVTSSPAPRRLAFALGRVAPPSSDEGPSNPAALSRVFKSFLRKGEDAVPVRYELTEDAAGITRYVRVCMFVHVRVWMYAFGVYSHALPWLFPEIFFLVFGLFGVMCGAIKVCACVDLLEWHRAVLLQVRQALKSSSAPLRLPLPLTLPQLRVRKRWEASRMLVGSSTFKVYGCTTPH